MNETNAEPYPGQFRIVWNRDKAEYRLNIPNYEGGEVVPLETVKSLEAHQSARIAELEHRVEEASAEVERLTKERDEARAEAESEAKLSDGWCKELIAERQSNANLRNFIDKQKAQLAEREEDRALLDWLDTHHTQRAATLSGFASANQLSYRAAIRAARAQPEDGK